MVGVGPDRTGRKALMSVNPPMRECFNPFCSDQRALGRAFCTQHESDLSEMLANFVDPLELMVL